MKKIFAIIVSAALAAGAAFAQDLGEITELYNAAATALSSGDKAGAFTSFQQALEQATALGADGEEIAAKCKDIIPTLAVSLAKEAAKGGEYDSAIEQLQKAAELALQYGNEDAATDAKELLPQVAIQKGSKLLSAKDFAAAAEAFKQALAFDPANGMAALRLGMALSSSGDYDGALEALALAAENGQKEGADKQIASVYLKQASASLKAKKFAEAVEFAQKAIEINPSAQAYQVAGQASQISGKNTDAIGYFEKYLELSPNAKNAGQIAYTLGALYQQSQNNAKAKEYYTKALSDPKFGAEAKKMLDALK